MLDGHLVDCRKEVGDSLGRIYYRKSECWGRGHLAREHMIEQVGHMEKTDRCVDFQGEQRSVKDGWEDILFTATALTGRASQS